MSVGLGEKGWGFYNLEAWQGDPQSRDSTFEEAAPQLPLTPLGGGIGNQLVSLGEVLSLRHTEQHSHFSLVLSTSRAVSQHQHLSTEHRFGGEV